jgi:5-methylcytosine-specific restriction endonuclease McrA
VRHRNWKGVKLCKDCSKPLRHRFSERCRSCEAKRKHNEKILNSQGANNPAWTGGASYEPYAVGWCQKDRDRIRARDNYECQNCGMTEEEHLAVAGQNLHVHHIDYNKKNCKDSNLIATCLWCNNRANYNRKYWQAFYTKRMAENKIKT